jgi:hypothetical protein
MSRWEGGSHVQLPSVDVGGQASPRLILSLNYLGLMFSMISLYAF